MAADDPPTFGIDHPTVVPTNAAARRSVPAVGDRPAPDGSSPA